MASVYVWRSIRDKRSTSSSCRSPLASSFVAAHESRSSTKVRTERLPMPTTIESMSFFIRFFFFDANLIFSCWFYFLFFASVSVVFFIFCYILCIILVEIQFQCVYRRSNSTVGRFRTVADSTVCRRCPASLAQFFQRETFHTGTGGRNEATFTQAVG